MSNKLNHIALILDVNKRWAKFNVYSKTTGYSKGFENIKNIVKHSLNNNIKNLTIFALSSENYNRSNINIIYEIIYENFSKIFDELVQDNGVKIKIFGSRNNLPTKVTDIFENIENISSQNNTLNLNIAFNYGFKEEIKNILQKVKENNTEFNLDNEKEIDKLFHIGFLPDPDLLIRTGGYQRLSNFIMYKLTYTELFFTETLWPDFSTNEYQSIIDKYYKIKRKYGL